ncbi:kelch-like protein 3 isoform X2 [Acyrthosiphon pisum]|nr:kelch-like protein 3 isoform X2 [Acyrthosiphon pisum]|eukprot:XP_003240190.1 PREDICTED: kelch-like protein 3 isoform X2 [Acyrthosiphon pisum]
MSIKGMDALQTTFWESDLNIVLTSKELEPTNFKNNSHSVTLLENLQSQRKNEVLCDVRFEADDGKIVIGHKNVLIAASPYFCAMFTSNFDESNKDIIKIRQIDSSILQQLIDSVYTGKIMITEKNVEALLPASSILQLDYVKGACVKFLQAQLDPTNCLGIKALADLYNCMELLLSSETFIQKQFIEVVKYDEFLSLSFEAVVKLISSNNITVPFEEKVFECIINWVNHELDCRKEFLPGLMEHVRLPLASIEYIFNKVLEEPLIKNDSKCNSYVAEALHFHLHKTNPHITIPQTIRCLPRYPDGWKKVILVLSWNPYKKYGGYINLYDPTTNKWKNAPEMTMCLYSAGLSITKDQFLFGVGGVLQLSSNSRSVEMLDLTLPSPIWVQTVDMLVGRKNLGVALLDDCLYAVGGTGNSYDDLKSVEVFNISTKKWQFVSSMAIERSHFGIGVLNNLLYAVGGLNNSCNLKSVECYDPSLDKWTTVTDMSVDRSQVSVGVLDGVIYAIGGLNSSGTLKSVEAYKPSVGVWTSVARMHKRRASAGVVAFDGLLYVMGGEKTCSTHMSFEIYNPATNSWKIESVDSYTVGKMYAAVVFNMPRHFRFN